MQVPGVNYFDTFAPVAKLASICTILAIIAGDDLEMHQIDIKGAYLNGELTDCKIIFMQQPPGYHTVPNEKLVCCLQKTLYGLKQSGCCWYQKLVEIMMTHLKFSRSDVDQAVFFCHNKGSVMIVLVHIDDCTITASSMSLINDFKLRISQHVEITNLGKLHWLLGIEVNVTANIGPSTFPNNPTSTLSCVDMASKTSSLFLSLWTQIPISQLLSPLQ